MRRFVPCLFALILSALPAFGQLTAAQRTTLSGNIDANTAVIPAGQPYAGVQVKDLPRTADGAAQAAWWYNQDAAGPYKVWNTAVRVKDLRAALDLSKYTPADTPPASGGTTTITNDQLLYQNRALVCQLKQANAIFLVQGEGTVDATPQQYRQSFNDCMVAIPSGAAGANANAGWGTAASPGAVRLAMQRNATNGEKVFSVQAAGAGAAGNVTGDPRGGATNPDALVVVGSISDADIRAIWGI